MADAVHALALLKRQIHFSTGDDFGNDILAEDFGVRRVAAAQVGDERRGKVLALALARFRAKPVMKSSSVGMRSTVSIN